MNCTQETHLHRFGADRTRCVHDAHILISTIRRVHKVVPYLFTTHINSHLLQKRAVMSVSSAVIAELTDSHIHDNLSVKDATKMAEISIRKNSLILEGKLGTLQLPLEW